MNPPNNLSRLSTYQLKVLLVDAFEEHRLNPQAPETLDAMSSIIDALKAKQAKIKTALADRAKRQAKS